MTSEHLDAAAADRIVTEAARDYFQDCRGRVEAFTKTNFSLGGSLRLHRHALGWDVVRAPANLALSLPQVGLKLGALSARVAGFGKTADRIGSRNIFLTTAVARELRWRMMVDLLRRPCRDGERVSTHDALAEVILARPEVAELVLDASRQVAARNDDPDFRRRLDTALLDYAGTRSAAADITTNLVAIGTGAIAYKQATPGMVALGPALAGSLAQSSAIANFPLGAGVGGVWYGMFPAQASPLLIAGSTAGLMGTAAVVSAFAGVVSDPVQRRLGLHQRRLMSLIDVMEKEFHRQPNSGFSPCDLYVARLMDLSDVLMGIGRVFRG